jgi:hypothetical protein
MFNYWKKVDSLNHLNRLLLVFVASLMLIVAGLLLTLGLLPKRYEFWLSPSITANGGLIKAGEIPNEYVQGFVATIMPALHSWSKAGKAEFAHNLASYHYYFTPRHRELLAQTLTAYEESQFFNRMQVASLYRFMEKDDVKQIGSQVWEVHLVLRITQRLNDESPMVITDKVVDYHLRITKVNLSRLQNPFQLALDGYTEPETLVKDLLAVPEKEKQHDNL